MTKKKLITIISENPNEKEVIFRRVDNQEIIPSEKLKLLKRCPEIIDCPSYMYVPSSINLEINFKEETNAVIIGKRYSDKYEDHYPILYCLIKK